MKAKVIFTNGRFLKKISMTYSLKGSNLNHPGVRTIAFIKAINQAS